MEESRRIEESNRQWSDENARLRAENAALKFRLTLTDVQHERDENEDVIYHTQIVAKMTVLEAW